MIGELANVFVQIILPALAVAAIGYVLGSTRPIDLDAITGLSVSVLVPAIVFDSLARTAVPREVLGRLTVHVALQLVVVGLLAVLAAHALGWRGPSRGALLLATLFTNSGNIGLPITLFAFGQPGLAIAGSVFALQAISTHTVGVLIAARARAGIGEALARLVRLPVVYAMLAGVLVNLTGASVPEPLEKVVQLLAGGALAVLLLLLGLQMARLTPRPELTGATVATAIRLLAAPPIAWVTGRAVGLEGATLSVSVLQASMPSAVTAALWAMEFDARPSLVSASVVLSTLLSVITLTVLLTVLTARP